MSGSEQIIVLDPAAAAVARQRLNSIWSDASEMRGYRGAGILTMVTSLRNILGQGTRPADSTLILRKPDRLGIGQRHLDDGRGPRVLLVGGGVEVPDLPAETFAALAVYVDRHPAVDEEQVANVAGLIDELPPSVRDDPRALARHLVARGVKA